MTRAELKAKFKKNHSHINLGDYRIFPIKGKKGNIIYWVQIKHCNYLYKNKKDALKIFFNALEI